jgi:hypothetical protein
MEKPNTVRKNMEWNATGMRCKERPKIDAKMKC